MPNNWVTQPHFSYQSGHQISTMISFILTKCQQLYPLSRNMSLLITEQCHYTISGIVLIASIVSTCGNHISVMHFQTWDVMEQISLFILCCWRFATHGVQCAPGEQVWCCHLPFDRLLSWAMTIHAKCGWESMRAMEEQWSIFAQCYF